MTPERTTVVNDHRVAEYYWNGRYVVYVDGKVFSGSYEQAIAQFEVKKVSNG